MTYRVNGSGIWNIKQARDSKNNSEYPREIYGEILVVAGGGGGGGGPPNAWQDGAGAGGGAGGLTYSCFAIIPGCQYNVAVGAGGTASTGPVAGTPGVNSCFGSTVTCGGGRGGDKLLGPDSGRLGQPGGSGGGASGGTGFGVCYTGIPGQGFPGGGLVAGAPGAEGGGGGGAGQAGNDPANPHAPVSPAPLASCTPNNGGNGLAFSISGTSTFYAGGGGGGRSPTFPGLCPSGGSGGGGQGGNGPLGGGTAGTANLGGGGGGNGSNNVGKNGGSGVVFLRVPNTSPLAVGCSGVGSEYLCAGFRVYKWTGAGSITF